METLIDGNTDSKFDDSFDGYCDGYFDGNNEGYFDGSIDGYLDDFFKGEEKKGKRRKKDMSYDTIIYRFIWLFAHEATCYVRLMRLIFYMRMKLLEKPWCGNFKLGSNFDCKF